MANFVRRLVSGNKARFKDDDLNLELDLVYVTDHLIIMGYPATSLEGMYRNRREDARKFLDHRHKKNYWVYNFCPLQENSYPSVTFDGRVSRYPFPDHHAPPLAILPLAAREIRLWLEGSQDRTAVLHCKAGKGRSGTVACAYLLSLDERPVPPRLERSYSKKEWSKARADEWMKVVKEEGVLDAVESTSKEKDATISDTETPSRTATPVGEKSAQADLAKTDSPPDRPADQPMTTLESVLSLHTSRRMRPAGSASEKQKQGVSIPSQKRWLYYWSQILSNSAPAGFWSLSVPAASSAPPKHLARIVSITVRLKEPTGAIHHAVNIATALLDRAASMKGKSPSTVNGPVWISLARYDDAFVETLEKWEKHSRHDEAVGRRRPGSEHFEREHIDEIFESGKWDKQKMVRRFVTMGTPSRAKEPKGGGEGKEDRMLQYDLVPLTDSNWTTIKKAIDSTKSDLPESGPQLSVPEPRSADASVVSLTTSVIVEEAQGVVVDARREVRGKLYMGQIPMGWFWFIPIFHMSQSEQSAHLMLKRKEVDFPLGPGEWLVDVDISMAWELDQSRRPEKQKSAESDTV